MSKPPLRLVISPAADEHDRQGFYDEFTSRVDDMPGRPIEHTPSPELGVTFYGTIARANVLEDGISIEVFVEDLRRRDPLPVSTSP